MPKTKAKSNTFPIISNSSMIWPDEKGTSRPRGTSMNGVKLEIPRLLTSLEVIGIKYAKFLSQGLDLNFDLRFRK